jgi:hypothetical protein
LRIENLEPRLALTWAGVPPLSIAVPAAPVALTLNSQGDASTTAAIATTEVDYYSFVATTTGSYMITATTPSSDLDTVLGIFSATGQRVAYNDDMVGINSDSRVSVKLTAESLYFVAVTNYLSTSRGSYTVSIDGATPMTFTDDMYENNDSFGMAFNLGPMSEVKTITGLKLADTADWYKFTSGGTGTESNSVSISFQHSQGNLQLALFSSTGAQLAVSQTNGNTETISLNNRAAGTYYIRVYGANNPNYSLKIDAPLQPVVPPTGSGFSITLAMSGLTANQEAVFNQAAARWSQIIIGDLPNAVFQGVTVDDVLIAASAVPIDGVNGILGQAAPDAFRSDSSLPYHGFMQFDTADLASLEESGELLYVILHEMGHVLGIGTIWSRLGLLAGAGSNTPTFIGAQATAAYTEIFATTGSGVPVENSGGGGTRDSHWRETILKSELMTGYLDSGQFNAVSRITVGSLADMGYIVNIAAADPYTKPAGSGGRSSLASSRALIPLLSIDTDSVGFTPGRRTPIDGQTVGAAPEASPPSTFFVDTVELPEQARRVMRNSQQLNAETVDAAVAHVHQQRKTESSDDFCIFDDSDDANFNLAWEDIGSLRQAWSALAQL